MELSEVHHKLIKRLASGRFLSGQQLANELGVSRASIWNYLKTLEEVGFELHAVKGRGTRFASPLELLNDALIKANIPAEKRDILQQLDVLNVCSSTNHCLAEQNTLASLPSGAISPTAFHIVCPTS
jgi:BirA family biotin operon repressor/biotin-[acetyl-CoA-carboxylase] ligase